MPASAWTPIAVFVLLVLFAGLWYGARGVKRGRGAPAWANRVDRYRGLFVGALILAVALLVGFAAVAVLSPLFD